MPLSAYGSHGDAEPPVDTARVAVEAIRPLGEGRPSAGAVLAERAAPTAEPPLEARTRGGAPASP
ncbi:hypothetical protein ACFRDV_01285 [Streptomyces fagopyri]|uniref:hypothetical protein n=1 Tax=Streptomyces fagopyri TaxID=2662397 RepID=UPI00367A2BE9